MPISPFIAHLLLKWLVPPLGNLWKLHFSKRVSRLCVSHDLLSFASAVSAQTVIVSNLLQSLLGIRSEVTMTVTIAAMILLALQGGMKGLARINMVHVVGISVSRCGNFYCGNDLLWDGTSDKFTVRWSPRVPLSSLGSRSNSIIGTLAIQPFVTVVNALSISAAIGARTPRPHRRLRIHHAYFAIFLLDWSSQLPAVARFLWPDMDPGTAWYTIAGHYGPAMAALASCGVLAASMSTARPTSW